MTKTLFTLFLFVFVGQSLFAQIFDATTYSHLVKADKDEFILYAKSVGLTIVIDTASQILFAKTKGCIYAKPLGDKSNNEYYDLALIVSTLDEKNNKLILQNAMESSGKKGTWTDNEYLYMEWDLENPVSKEMWYKVIVYKRKK